MAEKEKRDIIEEEIVKDVLAEEIQKDSAEVQAGEVEETSAKRVYTSASPLEGEGLRGDGTAKWYVVHTYSGYENKVKNSIDRMVEYRGMQDLILEVVIPTEDRVEIKDGVRKVKTRKLFPGYAGQF